MAGGFGFFKPQQTSVRAGDVPKFGALSMQEKLMMLGATLRGDYQGAQAIPMMAAARAKQAQQAGLDREFERYVMGEGVPTLTRRDRPAIAPEPEPEMDAQAGAAGDVMARLGGMDGVPMRRERVNVDIPQFGVEPGERRSGPPTLRDALPLLMKRRAAGIDIKTDIDMLDKAGPDLREVNGLILDMRDTKNAGRQLPKLGEGQKYLFDETGRVEGVKNADGYVQSVAELERAKARATEEERARLDVGKYDLPDGSTQQMPRLEAAGVLSGVPMRGGGRQGSAGVPGGVATPPGLGRSQTPAEKARAEGRAKTDVEIEALTPKATSALETMDRKSDFVLSVLDDILGEKFDPATGEYQAGDKPMVSGWTAGLGDALKAIPGTPARNLDSKLDTLRATLGFGELQTMRDNSPTGGAVGNLTERELSLLSSLMGSLDQGQDPEQLAAILRRQRDELRKISGERRRAFERQYKARKPSAQDRPAAKPRSDLSAMPLADRMAEARRRGLIQ